MTTVKALIEEYAVSQPDKTFMVSPESGREMSYAELKSISESLQPFSPSFFSVSPYY